MTMRSHGSRLLLLTCIAWAARAEESAPVAWGDAVEGLRLGIRANLKAGEKTPPTWSLLFQNTAQEARTIRKEADTRARVTLSFTAVTAPPQTTAALEQALQAGDPTRKGEERATAEVPAGQTIEVSLPPCLRAHAVLRVTAKAQFQAEGAAEQPPAGSWEGTLSSGALTLYRTAAGWAAQGPAAAEPPDAAAPAQAWQDFAARKPEFLAALQGKDYIAQRDAAQALGKLGAEARDAAPALAKLLEAEDPYEGLPLHQDAVEALGQAGGDSPEAVAALAKTLGNQGEEGRSVRLKAVQALGRLAPSAEGVAALAKALKDAWGGVRCEAALQLGKRGPAAKDALPALREALKDPLGVVHEAAREAISTLSAGAKER
jgi:hypothetical protein